MERGTRSTDQSRSRSILFFSDDEHLRGELADVLAVYPLRITVPLDVRDAVRALQARRFDALVVFAQPDSQDEWRLMSIARSGRFCSANLPMVSLVSSDAPPIMIARAREYGARCVGVDVESLGRAVLDAIEESDRASILIVEDDPAAASVAEHALETSFAVEVARECRSGLAAWYERRQEVVLLDLMLPDGAGAGVLREIRRADSDQPIVVLSAYATVQAHEELILAGASEVLPKPVDLRLLRDTCDRALRDRDYVVECRHVTRSDDVLESLGKEVWAMKHLLDTGQAAGAARLMASAVERVADAEPSDDEWNRLFVQGGPLTK